MLGVGQREVLEQMPMFGTQQVGSCGVSAVIFGLMMMAVTWAPNCNLKAFFCWRYHLPTFFDIPIALFCLGMVFIQFLLMKAGVAFHSFPSEAGYLSGPALHLMGAAIGLGVALAMLRLGQVETDRRDIFSIIRGASPEDDEIDFHGRSSSLSQQLAERESPSPMESDRRRHELQQLVASRKGAMAWADYLSCLAVDPDWRSESIDLLRLIGLLDKQQSWDDAIPAMVEYLRLFDERSDAVRIQLASVLLEHAGRPTQAQHVLAKIKPHELSQDQLVRLQQLVAQARQREQEDALFVVEDW